MAPSCSIMRHAESIAQRAPAATRANDPHLVGAGLSALGELQAAAIGDTLAGFDTIVMSPLVRCLRTVAIALAEVRRRQPNAKLPALVVDVRLRELGAGMENVGQAMPQVCAALTGPEREVYNMMRLDLPAAWMGDEGSVSEYLGPAAHVEGDRSVVAKYVVSTTMKLLEQDPGERVLWVTHANTIKHLLDDDGADAHNAVAFEAVVDTIVYNDGGFLMHPTCTGRYGSPSPAGPLECGGSQEPAVEGESAVEGE